MHISFDFDYTLADSTEGIVACINYALGEMGFPPAEPADISLTIGHTLAIALKELTGQSGQREAERFKQLFLVHAEQVMLDHIRFYAQTRPVLETLRRDGHYLSIVSTKERERIDAALARDGLADLVDQVVGGGCVANNKPHPEGLLRAMSAAGISRQETVYVGDSVADGECAAMAGVPFVGVLSGKTPASKLEAWKPWRLLANVGELTPFVPPQNDDLPMLI